MPLRRTALRLAAVTAALAVLTGCGGDEDPKDAAVTPSPSATLTGPGTDPQENLSIGDEFVAALAENTADSLAGAEDLVAPRSAAADHLADLEDGAGEPLTLTEVSDGRYRLCDDAGTCTVYSDLFLVDGRVSSFKVDGKQVR